MAYIYQPDGRCVGTVSKQCLLLLQSQYEHAKAANPREHMDLGATTFPQDVAKLILRYKAHAHCGLTSPDLLVSTLNEVFGPATERFASPMDRNTHSPSYWAAFKQDQLFGANHDAYSAAWTGLSYAHPGSDDKACEKALRWAIASADAADPSTPVCVVIPLPFIKGRPHMKHLQYARIQTLGSIPASPSDSRHQMKHADHWKSNGTTPLPHRCDMLVVAVYNAAGKARWLTHSNISEWQGKWGCHVLDPAPAPMHSDYKATVPRALHNIACADPPPPPATRVSPAEKITDQNSQSFTCSHSLCAPTDGVYTDGSCIKNKGGGQSVGAAVYITKNKVTLKINPNGVAYTNTINRAELSAIHQALTQPDVAEPGEAIYIYTDSLCSIHMIRRILDAPWSLSESKHFDLLQNILNALLTRAESGGMTHIYKVKSHSAISGNDVVDLKAKEAAMQPDRPSNIIETSNNAPYDERAWASLEPNATAGTADPDLVPQYVPSLLDGVKRAITPKYSGGRAAKKGVYVTAWAMAVPATHKPSNAYMWKDSQVTWGQCMRTMRARWGLLWNQNLAYKCKMAPSPNCPLCGQVDSISHLLGGCSHPVARAMKISRHDESVKLIQKAIALGPLGGFYTVMDAGAERDLPEDVSGKRVPMWILPPIDANHTREERQAEETSRRKMRPDILILEGLDEKDIRGKPEDQIRSHINDLKESMKLKVHVIEVGYCTDLNHASKDLDKRKQHEDLVALLRTPCPHFGATTVRFHDPVTLGHCGTIPASLITLMKETFDLAPSRADEYAKKLNRIAVQWVDKIYKHRQCALHQPG